MSIRGMFLGAWILESQETVASDGSVHRPLGEDPVGLLMYDSSGRVGVNMMRTGRPLFESNDMASGTSEEIQAAYSGYIAYSGRFELDEAANTVTHVAETSLFPNLVGERLIRHYRFEGDKLRLSGPPVMFGGVEISAVLNWRKAKG